MLTDFELFILPKKTVKFTRKVVGSTLMSVSYQVLIIHSVVGKIKAF